MAQQVLNARAWLEQARGRLVIGLVLLIGLYFVVAFGEQAWKARQLQAEVAERQAVVAALEERQDGLEAQLAEYNSERYLAYVERAARRDLNLSHPGETVLLVRWTDLAPTPTAGQASPTPDAAPESNWQRWLDLFDAR